MEKRPELWRRSWPALVIAAVAAGAAILLQWRGSPMAAVLVMVDGLIVAGYAMARRRSAGPRRSSGSRRSSGGLSRRR
ncbi:hypothetical protein [Actinoplanes sp. NPDC023714]|uniref:hypothetical protein n=1 Tax=Actinoplanes sp. NPDC023714 TaxID=3154322 RepID=UPI0033FE1F34